MTIYHFGLEGCGKDAHNLLVEVERDDTGWSAFAGEAVRARESKEPDLDLANWGGYREALAEAVACAEDMGGHVYRLTEDGSYAPANITFDDE